MNEVQRAKIVLKILNKTYPKIKVPLKSRNVFTLLISVLLSAQCTDVNVNNVTKNIYPKYNKPKHFVKLGRKKIERLIRSIGIFRVKAKSIYKLSKTLLKKFFPSELDAISVKYINRFIPKLIFPAFKIGIFFEYFFIWFSCFLLKPVVPITTFFLV